MKCPKCGNNFSGRLCPKCGMPAIKIYSNGKVYLILGILSFLFSCIAMPMGILSAIISLVFITMGIIQINQDKILKESIKKLIEYYNNELSNCREKYENPLNQYQSKIDSLKEQIDTLKLQRKQLQKDILALTLDVDNKSIFFIGLQDSKNLNSEEIRDKLALLDIEESDMLKNNKCIHQHNNSYVNKTALNNNIKQLLRCFNSECTNIIQNVTIKNIQTSRNKILRSFESLNKIFKTDNIELTNEFLELKFKQLNLVYEYQNKKLIEKEEQVAIREQMVEEEKARREIEREKVKIEKEEKQFKGEIKKLMEYLQKASEVEKKLYVDKINELENKLKLLEKDKENVLNREQNTRSGFVYIISNIGSFGNDIYKIGMTRRLEPMDRIKELSSASVPFEFDVHAMIFSEDAPKLESILHNTFKDRQVNKVNSRKEFYNVNINEIEAVVKDKYNATVTFTKVAEASQYRQSLELAKVNS
mgnify:CR=1 FL=1